MIGLLTTVNCSASVSRFIAAEVEKRGLLRDFPTIDGIVALTHTSGCAMPTGGEGFELLRRTILGYANHPNFGGVLLLSLGCETNELQGLMEDPRLDIAVPHRALVIQEEGGTRETVQAGIDAHRRSSCPPSRTSGASRSPPASSSSGMECGGSDGYSGISANPVVGRASDRIVWQGGTAAFAETPEIYGAEHLLAARARDPRVAQQLFDRIAWWERYTALNDGSMDSNPAPGNKAGGITTILEKSLGAIAKGGTTDLVEVVEYAEPMHGPGPRVHGHAGLRPGVGRPASSPAARRSSASRPGVARCSAASRCHRSRSPATRRCSSGCATTWTSTPVASSMARRRVDEVGDELFELILEVASGRQPLSEQMGIGQDEFAPWLIGRRDVAGRSCARDSESSLPASSVALDGDAGGHGPGSRKRRRDRCGQSTSSRRRGQLARAAQMKASDVGDLFSLGGESPSPYAAGA